jgi:hypothetical protein
MVIMSRAGKDGQQLDKASALHPDMRLGRNARYANASSRYPSAATASQRARKAGWPPL